MRVKIDASLSYHFAQPADVVLALEAIRAQDQFIVSDQLTLSPTGPLALADGPELMGRRQWTTAVGDVNIRY